MERQRTTLSFLTESKASAVGLSSMRRVVMTLLVMLLTTASAIAQNYWLTLDPNCDELMGTTIPVSSYSPTYTLSKNVEPSREGRTFYGWSETPTGDIKYVTGDVVTLSGNLTLYAIWDKTNMLTLDANCEGGTSTMVFVPVLSPTYTLPENVEPTREGHTFKGWSVTSTGPYQYSTGDIMTLTDNLTLYAIWDDSPCPYKLTYTITDEELRQAKLSGYEGDKPKGTLDIPATAIINGIEYSMTSIGDIVFKDCNSLESITIPNSVTSIADAAFMGCRGLASVTVPNSVTDIGYHTFEDCSSLESVTIPNRVTNIGDYTFSGCSSLESVTIPNSVTSIGNDAFAGCSSLQSVTIPNSVTSIGSYAFSGCSNLQSVTIPNSVTSIGKYAFRNCSSLQSVTIPNSVTSIGHHAFEDCVNLTSVTLNSNPDFGIDVFKETPATVTMNLTASNVNGAKWTTFYNNGYNFEADENTTVYKGTVNGSSLMLTEVADRIVNSGTAVILKSSGNPVMTLTESNSSDTNGNDLRGYSNRSLRTDVMYWNGANTIYTMGNTSAGFGFHRYTGEYVPAGKAFLPLNTAGARAQSLTMVFAKETTGIKSMISDDKDLQNDWYSLDGTRLNGKPSQHGIYINGNKKVVVK